MNVLEILVPGTTCIADDLFRNRMTPAEVVNIVVTGWHSDDFTVVYDYFHLNEGPNGIKEIISGSARLVLYNWSTLPS